MLKNFIKITLSITLLFVSTTNSSVIAASAAATVLACRADCVLGGYSGPDGAYGIWHISSACPDGYKCPLDVHVDVSNTCDYSTDPQKKSTESMYAFCELNPLL